MHLRYRVYIFNIYAAKHSQKVAFARKICYTTYKIICIYQKKAVPL